MLDDDSRTVTEFVHLGMLHHVTAGRYRAVADDLVLYIHVGGTSCTDGQRNALAERLARVAPCTWAFADGAQCSPWKGASLACTGALPRQLYDVPLLAQLNGLEPEPDRRPDR
jgi:hypothetical protein